MHRFRIIVVVILTAFFSSARAEEPFLKKGDVIALVGGEDMVAASEYGYLELLLTRSLPDYHLKFRNLAWEGDTVFEQPRQLNFPTWEQQLEKIGATVVICQFGQMESLAGKEKLPEFIAAYEKLLVRFSGGGRRRLMVLSPTPMEARVDGAVESGRQGSRETLSTMRDAIGVLAERIGARYVDLVRVLDGYGNELPGKPRMTRDGFHLSELGDWYLAEWVDDANLSAALRNDIPSDRVPHIDVTTMRPGAGAWGPVLAAIIAKNRLWFDYWRPQNWAFLNGDRITQPSSRDHRDPNVRWFPAEMEQFLPLIAAKEEAIWKLAAELN
jgi:hypothetical protein